MFINAPWYRRDVDHGGRFWEWPRGQILCNDPEDLVDSVLRAWEDPPGAERAREEMVRDVYVATDGKATQRALDAIRSVI